MRQKRSWVVALVLALMALARPAQAATYTVNSTNDVNDGACNLTHCSLREAINAANTNPGDDIIEFNITSGCGAGGVCIIQPTSALPALSDDGTIIDGYTQSDATPATTTTPAVIKIEIDGTNAGASTRGLTINSSNNSIKGLVINRFGRHGVYIYGSGATGNIISGNHIGTDVNGTLDRGNALHGIRITDGAQNNTVGGNTPADRNVISGNEIGVSIHGSDGNTVSGNYIGTDASGTDDLGNTYEGVRIGNGVRNTIGGDTVSERNIISGNGENGVNIGGSGATGNTVSGNYIGIDASGTAGLANVGHGVSIGFGAQNNTVGGDTVGERNVISGNSYYGVNLSGSGTTGNTVSGNYIGTDVSSTLDLGNAWHGVYIGSGAQNNAVGPGNVIVHNGRDGVEVNGNDTIGNTITQNSILSNTLGIDLRNGANGSIAAPVIVTTTGSVNIVGTTCAGCSVEVFENSDTNGEGEIYVGYTTTNASSAFTVSVSSLSKPYLTATATDAISGTSEFSAVFIATVTNGGKIYLPLIMRDQP